MARTINGNLTGSAAHRTLDEQMEQLERTPTDIRIGQKKMIVREMMGDDFMPWYKTTPFNSAALEKALDEKADEYVHIYDNDIMLYEAHLERQSHCDPLEFVDDWAGDEKWQSCLDSGFIPADWPWTDDDLRDEIMNRYPM